MPPGRLVGAIIIIFIPEEVRMYKRANGNRFFGPSEDCLSISNIDIGHVVGNG